MTHDPCQDSQVTPDELDSLSGVELRRRLEQRDVHPFEVDMFVSHRDDCPDCRARLLEML